MGALPDLANYQEPITAEEFEALAKASLAIADAKLKEAIDYASASAYFTVAGKISTLPEPPKPLMESFMGQSTGPSIRSSFRRGFNPTPAQIRAAQRMTKNLFKMHGGNMEEVASSVHKEFLRTGAERVVQYPDVLQVLKTMSGMLKVPLKEVQPVDSIGRIRGHADDVLRVAGVCSAVGGVYYTLGLFDTTVDPPVLPEDWFF